MTGLGLGCGNPNTDKIWIMKYYLTIAKPLNYKLYLF